MLKTIHGCDFSDWILERMPIKNGKPNWYYTIGIGNEKRLLAAVILFDYDGNNIYMGVARDGNVKYWLNKRIIGEIADFVFNHLGCVRVTARTQPENTKARRMLESIGFVCEGIMRQGYGNKDMLIYGILQSEAERWMKRKEVEYAQ